MMASIRPLMPGLLLSAVVAGAAELAAPVVAKVAPIPAMVIALIIGITLNPIARRPTFQPGISFCLKSLLRWAVALLGLRVALGEIAALGFATALLVVVAMVLTIASGFLLARLFRQNAGYGALAGAGTAICGASATLDSFRNAAARGAGLLVAFCTYLLAPRISQNQLAQDFALNRPTTNPAFGKVIGTLGIWDPSEMATIPIGRRAVGSSTGKILISGYLVGNVNAEAGKIARKRPVASNLIRTSGEKVSTVVRG
jgi:hypothetical protein